MTIISVKRKNLEKIKKMDENELNHLIAMMGASLEEYGEELKIEIFPNRPDLLSEQGFLRFFKSFTTEKIKRYNVKKGKEKIIIDSSLKDIRPYTACAIIKNLKINDEKIKEIIDIQEKLHLSLGRNRKKLAIGIYPLEKIKFPITFKALIPENIKFIPLEFPRELNGRQILSQHPAGREYGRLLEGKDKFPVFIDANNEILSMPPIINSQKTGKITENTKEVFIECSGFDLELLKKCLNILVCAFADIQGEIYSLNLIYGNKKEITPNLAPEIMKLERKNAEKLLGIKLTEQKIKSSLSKMGLEYSNGKVKIPAYRIDFLHEVDIIEDLILGYGFNKLVPEIPKISTIGEENNLEIIKRKISEILIGKGMLETSSFHLTNKKELEKAQFSQPYVKLLNGNEDYNICRPSLLVQELSILSKNSDSEYPQNIFELGKVFKINEKTETGTEETDSIAITLCSSTANFTEIKQLLDYLCRMLNLTYKIEETKNSSMIEGRTGKIIINNKEVGFLGEIHPQILENFKIKFPVSALELNLSSIFQC